MALPPPLDSSGGAGREGKGGRSMHRRRMQGGPRINHVATCPSQRIRGTSAGRGSLDPSHTLRRSAGVTARDLDVDLGYFFAGYGHWTGAYYTPSRAPVGQGPPGPGWLATSLVFWSGRALATGTAWAVIHHHREKHYIYIYKTTAMLPKGEKDVRCSRVSLGRTDDFSLKSQPRRCFLASADARVVRACLFD